MTKIRYPGYLRGPDVSSIRPWDPSVPGSKCPQVVRATLIHLLRWYCFIHPALHLQYAGWPCSRPRQGQSQLQRFNTTIQQLLNGWDHGFVGLTADKSTWTAWLGFALYNGNYSVEQKVETNMIKRIQDHRKLRS
jgi:hypothetical protein